jgi:hypothetical protein
MDFMAKNQIIHVCSVMMHVRYVLDQLQATVLLANKIPQMSTFILFITLTCATKLALQVSTPMLLLFYA